MNAREFLLYFIISLMVVSGFFFFAMRASAQVTEDTDGDGFVNGSDNCNFVWNPDQYDNYGAYRWGYDYRGNACQPTNDTDGDVAWDIYDNCILIPNTNQNDIDSDGYGNVCDADFDNNNFVDASDFGMLKGSFLSGIGDPRYNAKFDLNEDGFIDGQDFSVFKGLFLKFAGPSGRNCRGYANCGPMYPYCASCNWWGW